MRFLLSFFLLYTFGSQVQAKLIKSETLLAKILENYQYIYQFYAEATVTVYDSEAFHLLNEEGTGNNISYVLTDRAYTQNVIFMRDEYLLIETKDLAGTLLHLYIKEGGKVFNMNIDKDRKFHTEDVIYPYAVFFTKFISVLKTGLSELGITLLDVRLKRYDNRYVYQLGTEEENVKVSQDDFRVLEANRTIRIRGEIHHLKTTFQKWDQAKKRIPRLLRYYIDNRLLKEVWLTKVNIRGNRARESDFIKKYRHYLSPSLFTATINYAR